MNSIRTIRVPLSNVQEGARGHFSDLKNKRTELKYLSKKIQDVSKNLGLETNPGRMAGGQLRYDDGKVQLYLSTSSGIRYDHSVPPNKRDQPDSKFESIGIDILLLVSGETYRSTMDGPVDNSRSAFLYNHRFSDDLTKKDIDAAIPEFKKQLEKALEKFEEEKKKLEQKTVKESHSASYYHAGGPGPAQRNAESQAPARDWATFTKMNRDAHAERKKCEDSVHRRLQANGFEMVGDKKIQVKAGMKFMFPFDVSVRKPIGPIKKELHAGSSGPYYARANRIKTVTKKDLEKYNFEYVVGHTYVWFKK